MEVDAWDSPNSIRTKIETDQRSTKLIVKKCLKLSTIGLVAAYMVIYNNKNGAMGAI